MAKSEFLSKLLSKALQLWLRSQVSHVTTLELTIYGTNQQLLSGEIPQVDLAATHAVYQDLHLSEVHLTGKNIKIDLSQILKGKPIKLLEPIPVVGQLRLTASDLQASLPAPLLATALGDLFQTLVVNSPSQPLSEICIHWQQAAIAPGSLKLVGSYQAPEVNQEVNQEVNPTPSLELEEIKKPKLETVILQTGLTLAPPHQFSLTPLQVQLSPQEEAIALEDFLLNLGSDVVIQDLSVTEGQLVCQGQLTVQP